MAPKLNVRAQGPIGRWADAKFDWMMRHISGAPNEATQRTHRWNNHHLSYRATARLNAPWMVSHNGDPQAKKPLPIPLLAGAQAHAAKYGGWQRYLVLEPSDSSVRSWYVGWRWPASKVGLGLTIPSGAGVSRIPDTALDHGYERAYKRVLIGPGFTEWFGICTHTNKQIPIEVAAEGQIGTSGRFAGVPLF